MNEPTTPATAWYYVRESEQAGPVSLAQLQELAAKGELGPSDLVLREGTAEWAPVGSVTNLFPHAVGHPSLTPLTPAPLAILVPGPAVRRSSTPPAAVPAQVVPHWIQATGLEDKRKRWVLLVGGAGVLLILLLILSTTGRRKSQSEAERKSQSEAEKTKQAILFVLKEDSRFAKKKESELKRDSTPSQIANAIAGYCIQAEALDMASCPADFKVAYRQHIRAWREAQRAFQEMPDGIIESLFTGAANGFLRGETDGGYGRMSENLKRAIRNVKSTWEEVEKVGAQVWCCPLGLALERKTEPSRLVESTNGLTFLIDDCSVSGPPPAGGPIPSALGGVTQQDFSLGIDRDRDRSCSWAGSRRLERTAGDNGPETGWKTESHFRKPMPRQRVLKLLERPSHSVDARHGQAQPNQVPVPGLANTVPRLPAPLTPAAIHGPRW